MEETDGGWCPACGRVVAAWAPGPGGRARARCPICQALERHRFLCLLIDRLSPVVASARAVLDIAPQPQVRGLLERFAGDRYVGIDLLEDRKVDAWADLTRLPFRDATFDLAVCYHVLEHIPDDSTAMRELARVLTPGGLALVQVPWRRGTPTDEDPNAPEAERIRRFGQADHVRWYGEDLLDRLRSAGLQPAVLEPRMLLDEASMSMLAVASHEPVLICRPASEPSGHELTGHDVLDELGPVGLRITDTTGGSESNLELDQERGEQVLAEQVRALEGQLEEIYSSRTWRAGAAMLAVPKRLKAALLRR